MSTVAFPRKRRISPGRGRPGAEPGQQDGQAGVAGTVADGDGVADAEQVGKPQRVTAAGPGLSEKPVSASASVLQHAALILYQTDCGFPRWLACAQA
jgi:hypothetical protein